MPNSDDEILLKSSELCKYLSKNFEKDFETYDSITDGPAISPSITEPAFEKETRAFNLVEDDIPSVIPVSEHDYKLVCVITQSKLLFLDDLEIIEGLFSQCTVKETHKLISFSPLAMASASLLSIALLCLKAPTVMSIGFSSISAGLLIWESFKTILNVRHVKQLTLYVEKLQNLCYNIHSLLRFLKETEILTTGQVSSDNIGSAMYMPLSDVDLNNIPSWKILPHLRQCLHESMAETVTILSDACDVIKDSVPPWLHISGFTLKAPISISGQVSAIDHNSEKYHSIKNLQSLCEMYLKVQSEFLKWIAFNLCPYVWCNSPSSLKTSKANIFKVLKKTSTKLSAISSKLKLQFDMIQIFSHHKPKPYRSLQFSFEENKNLDMQIIQADLHKIFLSALLMLQKTKNLEDKLDKSTNQICVGNETLDLSGIENNLIDELSSVRSDLLKITQAYEEIYLSFTTKNSTAQKALKDHRTGENLSETEELVERSLEETKAIEKKQLELKYGINSPDEVFLAITGGRAENSETFHEDSWIERKPQVPKSLLNELSTSLIPIQKDFREREKLALERSGLQDIKDETTKEAKIEVSTQTSRKRKFGDYCYTKISSDTSLSSTEDSSSSCEENSMCFALREKTMGEEWKSLNRPTPTTVLSLANALNTAKHNFVKLEEEFYSEDEEET